MAVLDENQIRSLESVIQARANMTRWLSQELTVRIPPLIVYWQWLCRQLKLAAENGMDSTHYLELLMSKVNQDLEYNPLARKNMLWKRYGPGSLPRAPEQLELLDALLEVDSTLSVHLLKDYEAKCLPEHPMLVATTKTKHDLLEGLATASYLCWVGPEPTNGDAEPNKHEELRLAMLKLPPVLKSRLEEGASLAQRVHAHQNQHEIPLLHWRRIWALHDIESVKAELRVLAKAMALTTCAGSRDESYSMYLHQARQFLSHSLAHSSRAPSELVPYKSLEWIADSPDKEQHAAWLAPLIQRALSSWLSRVWSGSFNLMCCHAETSKEQQPILEGPPWLTNNAWLPFSPSGLLVDQDEQIGQKNERIAELSGLLKFLCENPLDVEGSTSTAQCEVEILWGLTLDLCEAYGYVPCIVPMP